MILAKVVPITVVLQFHKILAPNLYIRVFPSGDVLYRSDFAKDAPSSQTKTSKRKKGPPRIF